jgi:hypothetical protein
VLRALRTSRTSTTTQSKPEWRLSWAQGPSIRLFAGVRFDEVDRDILFVYAKDEGTAVKIEDEFALHSDCRLKHNGARDQHRNAVVG